MTPSLTAHFIIHNDFKHIDHALRSLYQHTEHPCRVEITINQGDAHAIEDLRQRWPDCQIFVNRRPQGFAANHNRAMQRCQTPYIALLNDDIQLHRSAIDQLVDYLEHNPQVALVSPLVVNPDGSGQLSSFGDLSLMRALYRISGLGCLTPHGGFVRRGLASAGLTFSTESLKSHTGSSQPRFVPVVVGVAMVARRTAYEQAGVMDEDTRMYGEEYGWHYRLRQKGWQVALLPGAKVTHYNPTTDLKGWKLAEHRKSLIALFTRYKPRWQSLIVRAAIIVFHGLYGLLNRPFSPDESRAHAGAVKIALSFQIRD